MVIINILNLIKFGIFCLLKQYLSNTYRHENFGHSAREGIINAYLKKAMRILQLPTAINLKRA